ncbi:hypothetical protein HPB48_016783 [Haemaphysalis longicornis]|uniref:DNA mismatch repair proteins mutS family domain-containing protein n=1 Tax=Haemaphysalis longicornis TaxID=44386 RepID=A0A9J6FSJ2_HAELO|nr:hypothetical protein HPB48_016783 [Haemaphysalis longicornis]
MTLPDMPSGLSEEARFVYMSAIVDFNAIAMVRAAGALLNYLGQCKFDCLQGSQDSPLVRDVVMCSLKDRVLISRTTFGCLQIFKEEWHPSVYKCGISGKEGLSLFDRETEIMHKVQNMILEESEVLLEAVANCGELDALLSLAVVAREHNYVRPVLSNGPVITINGGRHPLVETAATSFVANTFASGGPHPKVKVITGPNNCGKSVYMKQVALIVYMAHIGSFVPAESAEIGAVDAILTCMYSEESLLHGLSSFGMQLNQANGMGLLVGTIQSFLREPATCPHTLLATHFHTLHEHLPVSQNVTYLTFESIRHEGELVYLYQLREGRASSSCASVVAQAAGLSADIIHRQQQVINFVLGGFFMWDAHWCVHAQAACT